METYLNVKGSKNNTYVISVFKDDEDSFFDCDCPAANFSAGQLCKHRLALLNGDFSKIINADDEEIALVKEFIASANIQNELEEINKIQSEFDRLQAEEKKLKSLLGQRKRDLLSKFYPSYDEEYDDIQK
ncbi:MAG: hypothetical protein K2Y14_04030 [Burkholderiales bacterium]|nr:hypothetical protein [Burkholderiales bacterium]